ncbi:MAG: toll/interleukin-1 receptor domain-containing protein, partial [Gemmatimonadetes bacterium]|nr:toll/interleukin-1 receptor domain-containing protein [Gemmatimonadota bacterium]
LDRSLRPDQPVRHYLIAPLRAPRLRQGRGIVGRIGESLSAARFAALQNSLPELYGLSEMEFAAMRRGLTEKRPLVRPHSLELALERGVLRAGVYILGTTRIYLPEPVPEDCISQFPMEGIESGKVYIWLRSFLVPRKDHVARAVVRCYNMIAASGQEDEPRNPDAVRSLLKSGKAPRKPAATRGAEPASSDARSQKATPRRKEFFEWAETRPVRRASGERTGSTTSATSAERHRRRVDIVGCSVFAPREVIPGSTVMVQGAIHVPRQAEMAEAAAKDADEDAERRGFCTLDVDVERGSTLTAHLQMKGLEIEEPLQKQIWRGPERSRLTLNLLQFGVTIPDDARPGSYMGTMTILTRSVPVGHLRFKLKVTSELAAEQVLPDPTGMEAKRYHKAFVSYASPDRPAVLDRMQVVRKVGLEVFQDVVDLDPGDRWERELYKHIDESDLFLLFWSGPASESEWVMREINYALERQGDGDEPGPPEILPIIIEEPIPAPPAKLQHLHFTDRLLYLRES